LADLLRDKIEAKEGYLFSYDEEWDMVPPNLTEAQKAMHYVNQWPDDFFPEFKKGMMTYWSHMLTLGRRLMRLFALGLDVEEDYFDKMMRAPLATIRTHRYSPIEPNNEDENGIGAHTDYESMSCSSDLRKQGSWLTFCHSFYYAQPR
jgi:isopenicillin N synthase-like dioxygenase